MEIMQKFIGILTVIGAIILIYLLIIHSFPDTGFSSSITFVWILVFILAFIQAVSAVATYQGKTEGFNMLIFCYLFELIAFANNKLAYLISIGPVLAIKYDRILWNLGVDFGIFQVAYKIEFSGDYSFFSINLFVLLILVALFRLKQRKILKYSDI